MNSNASRSSPRISPLLFNIVHQAITKEFKIGSPWKLLSADDMVFIVKSLPELKKFQAWRQGLVLKNLRTNLAKTKVIINRRTDKSQIPTSHWLCSIFRKVMGRNSVRFTWCKV